MAKATKGQIENRGQNQMRPKASRSLENVEVSRQITSNEEGVVGERQVPVGTWAPARTYQCCYQVGVSRKHALQCIWQCNDGI
jgi:hypothetical protein